MKRLTHTPALDGIRGLAIGAVVLYHADARFSGGLIGVDVFFVLSGFLITTLLLQEHAETGRISFRGFYLRRARRLFPVAFAGILAAELALLAPGLGRPALGGIFAAFYLENIAHYLHPPVVDMVGHYWSLSQEEQFYLLWPPLLYLLVRRRVRPGWIVGLLVASAVAVEMHRALLSDHWIRFYYAPDTRADGMLLGCVLAFVWRAGLLNPRRWWPVVGVLGIAVLAAAVLMLQAPQRSVGLYGITAANLAAAALIAAVLAEPSGLVARVVSMRWLCWLGIISYSLYIWQPIVARMSGLSGWPMVVAAFVVAWLSYRFVEQPFRRRRTGGGGVRRPELVADVRPETV